MTNLSQSDIDAITESVVESLKKKYILVERKNNKDQREDRESILVTEINNVAEVVCGYYGVSIEDVRSGTREWEYCEVRYVCWYILKSKYKNIAPLRIMGAFFSKNHSSVSVGLKKLTNQMEVDKNLRRRVEEVTKLFSK